MREYEYRCIPAPTRGVRARGLRGAEQRFARAVELLMNEMAGEGWHYLRCDTLPREERQGLGRRTTVYQNILVFRRRTAAEAREHPPSDAAGKGDAGGGTEADGNGTEGGTPAATAWRRQLRTRPGPTAGAPPVASPATSAGPANAPARGGSRQDQERTADATTAGREASPEGEGGTRGAPPG